MDLCFLSEADAGLPLHCKPEQVEPAYIECGNGAAAMQISSLDLLALPQHRSHIQCKLVQLVRVYSVTECLNHTLMRGRKVLSSELFFVRVFTQACDHSAAK